MTQTSSVHSNKPIANLSLDLDNEWAYLKTHENPVVIHQSNMTPFAARTTTIATPTMFMACMQTIPENTKNGATWLD